MTWTKLSDGHFERPEALPLSRSARLLEIEGLVYCNRTLTDGRIDRRAMRLVTDAEEPATVAAELVAAGLWVEDGDGFRIAEFHEHQPTAEEVRRRSEENATRSKRNRQHNKGDHSLCDPERCWQLNGKGRDAARGAVGSDRARSSGPESDPTPREERTKGPAGAGSRFASPAGGSPREKTPIFGPPPGTVVRVCGKAVTAA